MQMSQIIYNNQIKLVIINNNKIKLKMINKIKLKMIYDYNEK